MLAFLTSFDLEELFKFQYFARAAAPAFGPFMENRCTWVMETLCFRAVASRRSLVLIRDSATSSFASSAYLNGNAKIVFFWQNLYIQGLSFLFCILGNFCYSGWCRGMVCHANSSPVAVYFNTIRGCRGSGGVWLCDRCWLYRLLVSMASTSTARDVEEFVEI